MTLNAEKTVFFLAGLLLLVTLYGVVIEVVSGRRTVQVPDVSIPKVARDFPRVSFQPFRSQATMLRNPFVFEEGWSRPEPEALPPPPLPLPGIPVPPLSRTPPLSQAGIPFDPAPPIRPLSPESALPPPEPGSGGAAGGEARPGNTGGAEGGDSSRPFQAGRPPEGEEP